MSDTDTFVKIFSESGSSGEYRLENEINEMARKRNLDIVSTNTVFRKGAFEDTMFVVVVFRKKGE